MTCKYDAQQQQQQGQPGPQSVTPPQLMQVQQSCGSMHYNAVCVVSQQQVQQMQQQLQQLQV